MVKALLEAGANLEARNENGDTPLHRAAVFNENPAVIEALLEAGANLEARDELFGRTPLHSAAGFNKNPAVVKALLEAGADVNARNENGATPWDLAQENEALKGSDAYLRLN